AGKKEQRPIAAHSRRLLRIAPEQRRIGCGRAIVILSLPRRLGVLEQRLGRGTALWITLCLCVEFLLELIELFVRFDGLNLIWTQRDSLQAGDKKTIGKGGADGHNHECYKG